MNLSHHILEKVSYNLWANETLLTWIKKQPEDMLEALVMSSYPSLKDLLYHIMETEKYYLSILRGTKEVYDDSISIQHIFDDLLSYGEALIHWVEDQGDEDLAKIITLKRSPFEETYTVSTLITHLVNHSTQHRGQVLALRGQLNMSPAPKIDYYRFLIAKNHPDLKMDKF